MEFCESCGSFLRETDEGLWCPRCRKVISKKLMVEARSVEKKISTDMVYVVDKAKNHHASVATQCPECGNDQALHWVSQISGEHAGVRRERTVEHFKCTKCSHSWTKIS